MNKGQLRLVEEVGSEPFLLEDFLVGRLKAWGVFEARFGSQRRQFEVDVEGVLDGEVLTLREDFTFDDGETDTRTWVVTRTSEDSYEGQADDILGQAIGKVTGNTLNWAYDLVLKAGGRSVKVRFEDRMSKYGDDCVICQGKIKKFGILFGTVTMVFLKTGGQNRTV